jgi:hypothetical protein
LKVRPCSEAPHGGPFRQDFRPKSHHYVAL